MKHRNWIVSALLLACVAAGAPSEKSHYYVVEYERAPKGGVPIVNVTFFVPMTPERAEKIVRAELTVAVETVKPDQDTLGYAWDGRGKKKGDEDPIRMPGGAGSLVYVVKTGKIVSDKEAFKK